MKAFIVAALLIIALASVHCGAIVGYGGLGGLAIGRAVDIGPKAAIGPNIVYGGYTLTSHSVSGPLKGGLYKEAFVPGIAKVW